MMIFIRPIHFVALLRDKVDQSSSMMVYSIKDELRPLGRRDWNHLTALREKELRRGCS